MGKKQIFISLIVTVLNVKPYFCIFCDYYFLFLTSALSGTCCYKSSVGLFLQWGKMGKRGQNDKEEIGRRVAMSVFALHVCMYVRLYV